MELKLIDFNLSLIGVIKILNFKFWFNIKILSWLTIGLFVVQFDAVIFRIVLCSAILSKQSLHGISILCSQVR